MWLGQSGDICEEMFILLLSDVNHPDSILHPDRKNIQQKTSSLLGLLGYIQQAQD